jgi:hypothetical protein
MGFYDYNGNQLATTGSFAMSFGTAAHRVTLSASLAAGSYYLGWSQSSTASIFRAVGITLGGTEALRAVGMREEAGAFPLPATATFATLTHNYVPFIGFTDQTPVFT